MFNRILGTLLVITLSLPAFAQKAKFDYGQYMQKLQTQIKASWKPSRDKINKKAIAGFTIDKDGSISNLRILKSSGSTEYDRKALDTLEFAAPFGKLPKKSDIEFSFDYKVKKRKGLLKRMPLVSALKDIKGKFKFKEKEEKQVKKKKKQVSKKKEEKKSKEKKKHISKKKEEKKSKEKKKHISKKKEEKQKAKTDKVEITETKETKKPQANVALENKNIEELDQEKLSYTNPKEEKKQKKNKNIFKGIKNKLRKASKEKNDFKIGLPIDCELGDKCFIMLYPDHDPSPKAKDFTCGRMASNNNKGTVFVIQSEELMVKGVPVIASANGKVYRVRDGIPDKRIDGQDTSSVKGIECGNGVVINHDGEWQTQYCHMKNGTVKVSVGDEVKKGQILGYVGESGESAMPNLDFVVRHQNKAIDPFVGLKKQDPKEEDNCGLARNPIWENKLEYQSTGLVRLGFANKELALEDSWEGKFGNDNLAKNSDKLIFWAHSYGVLKDDVEELEIYAPDGSLFIKNSSAREKASRSALIYTGRKNPENFKKGKWKGKYKLIREGKVLIDTEKTIEVN